tara:strand:+ start:3163 stop:4698 length:1536 start_codon:yes stop_codon:yes gene_type:complete
MNILYLCQSNTLELFSNLSDSLKKKNFENKSAYIISDSKFYNDFTSRNKSFKENKYVIKEWELTKNLKTEFDINKIKDFEKKLDVNNFWDAILSDRRLIFGENFTFRQDYISQFNFDEIHLILFRWLISVEKLYDKFKPDIVVSFISTYLGEYISFLFSKKYNIPYYNLRPTRVENYIHFGKSPNEPSNDIKLMYEKILKKFNSKEKFNIKAKNFIENSINKDIKYEGVFLNTQKPPQSNNKIPNFLKFINNLKDNFKEEYTYRFNKNKCDRHLPGYIKPVFYRKLLNPILIKKINNFLNAKFINQDELKNINYAFFPLHIEPEVTLLVYSRFFMNQIEVIRNIAYSLPTGFKLVVKEHPAAVGKRPISFYKKLLNIPNVELVAPNLETRILIENSSIVTTIAGSVGFESIIFKKPVLTFGNTPYEFLPDTMVKKNINLNNLPSDIIFLLNNYDFNETNLVAYISSIYKTSIDVNFYSVLLKRATQYMYTKDSDYSKNLDKLSNYLIQISK